jgi:hypothetical protein
MESKGNSCANAVYEFNKEEAIKFKPKPNDLRQVTYNQRYKPLTMSGTEATKRSTSI